MLFTNTSQMILTITDFYPGATGDFAGGRLQWGLSVGSSVGNGAMGGGVSAMSKANACGWRPRPVGVIYPLRICCQMAIALTDEETAGMPAPSETLARSFCVDPVALVSQSPYELPTQTLHCSLET